MLLINLKSFCNQWFIYYHVFVYFHIVFSYVLLTLSYVGNVYYYYDYYYYYSKAYPCVPSVYLFPVRRTAAYQLTFTLAYKGYTTDKISVALRKYRSYKLRTMATLNRISCMQFPHTLSLIRCTPWHIMVFLLDLVFPHYWHSKFLLTCVMNGMGNGMKTCTEMSTMESAG